MKKLLGILVLGIGIVLLIPDKTLACQATVDSSTDALRTCDDDDILTITSNGSINRNWHTVSVPSGVDGATINNSGDLLSSKNTSTGIEAISSTYLTINNYADATIRSGGKAINGTTATNLTIDNAGTIKSYWNYRSSWRDQAIKSTGDTTSVTNQTTGTIDGRQKVVKSEASNFTLNNLGTIDANTTTSGPGWLHGTGKWTVHGSGTSAILTNSGTITAEDIYAVWLEGTSAEVTNTGTITAANSALHLEGASAILTNSGDITVTNQKAIVLNADAQKITNESGGTIQGGASGWDTDDLLAILISANATNLTLENSGTITSGTNTIKRCPLE